MENARISAADESTGRPLRDVYSVTLGVALALAVQQVIDVGRQDLPLNVDSIMPCLAFIILAFSLYHWAVRFIDVAHTENRRSSVAIVTSLLVGSVELVVLLVLAILVSRPDAFLVAFAATLAFEVLAGFSLRLAKAYGTYEAFARRYLLINGIAVMIAAAAVIPALTMSLGSLTAGLAALLISALRSVVFYMTGFSLLFGPTGNSQYSPSR